MNYRMLAATVAALGLMTAATAANAVVVVLPNVVDQLYTATGQTILWDFDSIANANTLFTGNEITDIQNPITTSAPPPLSQTAGGVLANFNSAGQPYYADPTDYGSVQGGGSSTFKTLNGSYLTSFSFYMGSPDSYNHLTFRFVGGATQAFNGDAIWGGVPSGQPGNGDRSMGFRVYYDFGGAHVDQITFASDTNAFEFDGLAGNLTTVPEPATWGLMILGFGAAGAMLRRRRPLTA